MVDMATICFGNERSHTFQVACHPHEVLHVSRALWVSGVDYIVIVDTDLRKPSWHYYQRTMCVPRPTHGVSRYSGMIVQEPVYLDMGEGF